MRVLLVDDSSDCSNNFIEEIEKEYVVDVAHSVNEGVYMSEVNDYDVIVVDGSVSGEEGRYLCRDIRNANIASPILYLVDSDDYKFRLETLKDGASVCVSRKVPSEVLSAQIKALLKLRHYYHAPNQLIISGLTIDMYKKEVRFGAAKIDIRKKEFSILEYLLLNKSKVVSKEELLDHVWEDGILMRSNSLEVHIRNIRLKVEKPFNIRLITTVRGFGYKIE